MRAMRERSSAGPSKRKFNTDAPPPPPDALPVGPGRGRHAAPRVFLPFDRAAAELTAS